MEGFTWTVEAVDAAIEAAREGRLGVQMHAYGEFRTLNAEEFLGYFREEVARGLIPVWNPSGYWASGPRMSPYFRLV